MIVRPIAPFERNRFAELADPEQTALRSHIEDALATEATSDCWCLVAEQDGRWLGARPGGSESSRKCAARATWTTYSLTGPRLSSAP